MGAGFDLLDPVVLFLVAIICVLVAGICWVSWLYLIQYRMATVAYRDRDRLIRRLGLYHNLPLITPEERLPDLPTDIPIPAAFRTVKPKPPYGWTPPSSN